MPRLIRRRIRLDRRPSRRRPRRAVRARSGGEADAEERLEALLDVAYSVPIARSSSPAVSADDGQLAAEEHGVLDADREVGADEPFVAAQEVLVQLLGVLLRRGHHVGLVAQRALTERDPDRREVLLLAAHAHVPASARRRPLGLVGAVDRPHDRRAVGERRQPLVDLRLDRAPARRRRAGRSRERDAACEIGSVMAHASATTASARATRRLSQVGVEPPQPGRREAPREVPRPRPPPRRPSPRRRAGRRAPASTRGRSRTGSRPSHEATGDAVVDEGEQPADRASPRRGCRTPRLRARPARSSRCGSDDDDVGGAVVGRQDVVRLRLDETHLVGDAELVDQGDRPAAVSSLAVRCRWRRRRSPAARRGGRSAASARIATSGP